MRLLPLLFTLLLCCTARADEVRLTVDDDGQATGAPGPDGFGLVGMAERAKVLGGTLEAGPRPGGGWSVAAVLPRHGSASRSAR